MLFNKSLKITPQTISQNSSEFKRIFFHSRMSFPLPTIQCDFKSIFLLFSLISVTEILFIKLTWWKGNVTVEIRQQRMRKILHQKLTYELLLIFIVFLVSFAYGIFRASENFFLFYPSSCVCRKIRTYVRRRVKHSQ